MPGTEQFVFETLEELSPQEEEYMRGKYEKVLEHVEEIDELIKQGIFRMESKPYEQSRLKYLKTCCL